MKRRAGSLFVLVALLLCNHPAASDTQPTISPEAGTAPSTCAQLKQQIERLKGSGPEALLMLYQQALADAGAKAEKKCKIQILQKIALLQRKRQDYEEALQTYREALPLLRELGDGKREAACLNSIGGVLQLQGKPADAIPFYQQALDILRELGDRNRQASTLSNLGAANLEQGLYAKALSLFQQALAILQGLDKPTPQKLGALLNNLGLVSAELGDYPQAIEYHEQALSHRRAAKDSRGSAQSLHNLGYAYYLNKQPAKALAMYQEALRLREQIDDRAGQAETLNNIGVAQSESGQPEQALASLNKALALFQAIGNRQAEGRVFDSLGSAYKAGKDYLQALNAYHLALTIAQETNDRNAQRITLGNIGSVLEKQTEISLAILFYKQSVNVSEAMRADLKPLPVAQRKRYAAVIAKSYRSLADLLLRQDRVLEAQRVLDLLKVQEAQDYLGKVRGTEDTAEGVAIFDQEEAILTKLERLQLDAIEVGVELTKLRTVAQRTAEQDRRVAELDSRLRETAAEFVAFIKSPDIRELTHQLGRTRWDQTTPMLKRLRHLSDNLRSLEQNAVLLYPLVLEERLELVLATAYAPPIHRPVPVDHKSLNETVLAFRTALSDRNPEVAEIGKRLYEWLIHPLEPELQRTNAETILYAPDGQLRYIPLAALHDGEHWMAQRFRINNITAESLIDLNTRPTPQPKVLAAAFTQGSHTVEVGPRKFDLQGLKFASRELESLRSIIPNNHILVDGAFSPDAIIPRMDDYTIVHLATHAAMVPEDPDESFILFGDGQWITLRDVESWYLTNVDLIVLSACETGLGGRLGNGEEILGFGYRLEEAGARASIASLWSVDDGGTEALMTAFYAAISRPGTSKAEALRKAQLALIDNDYTPLEDAERGVTQLDERIRSDVPTEVVNRLNHPYYWSPFILIGNGL